jgi:hypothetical protein
VGQDIVICWFELPDVSDVALLPQEVVGDRQKTATAAEPAQECVIPTAKARNINRRPDERPCVAPDAEN